MCVFSHNCQVICNVCIELKVELLKTKGFFLLLNFMSLASITMA